MKTTARLLSALVVAAITCTAMGANDPMLGQWTLSPASLAAQPNAMHDLDVSAVANGYDMRLYNKGFPAAGIMHVVLDGKPHPYMSVSGSPDAPGHPTSTCTRTQPRVITCLLAAEGEPSIHSTITLSADDKSLTMADPSGSQAYVRP